MKTSERATAAAAQGMAINPHDRDHLRESWRVAAAAHIAAEDAYLRQKQGIAILFDRLVGELIAAEPATKIATAERMARMSDAYIAATETMQDMRRHASDLKLAAADADRKYWESVSQEASARAEMKMTGYAR